MNEWSRDTDLVEQVLIAPRALAGGGDPRWITKPLNEGHGWKNLADPLLPEVRLASPDARSTLSLIPHADQPVWHLSGTPEGRPNWRATFSSRTPVEIIAGITDAMTPPPPATAGDPFGVLSAAGWHSTYGDFSVVRSPEGFTKLERYEDSTSSEWFIKTTVSGDPESHLWRAYFDQHTPPHLISAFASALASPEPLARPMSTAVPGRGRASVTTTSAWVPATDDADRLGARVRAAQRAAWVARAAIRPAPAPSPARRQR